MSQKLCECGCGQTVKSKGSRFCRGHGQTVEMRQANSKRMKDNNPMKRPDVSAKQLETWRANGQDLVASQKMKDRHLSGELSAPVNTPEDLAKLSARMKENNPMKDADVVARAATTRQENGVDCRQGERLRQRWQDPEYRASHVERMKKNNPMRQVEVMEKNLSGPRLHTVATKMEKWFAELMNQHDLPIWFSGLNEYWVKGRNPDFKVHDRRLVIEITDGYTFRKQARNHENYSMPTIAHYEENGHACLVVMMPERRYKWTDLLRANLVDAVRTFLASGKSAIWDFNQ